MGGIKRLLEDIGYFDEEQNKVQTKKDNDFINKKDLCKMLEAKEVRLGAYGIFVDWGD